jgi:hypothetical protein
MHLFAFFVVVVVAACAPARATTFLYLDESDAQTRTPSVTLYESRGRLDPPVKRVPLVSFSGNATDSGWYYVRGRLLHTNWDLGRRSSLWLHYAAFDVGGPHLRLFGGSGPWADAAPDAALHAACAGTGKYACVFEGSIGGDAVDVALFGDDATTRVPWALYHRLARDAPLKLERDNWARPLLVPGPFVGHDAPTVVLAQALRHRLSFGVRPAARRRPGAMWVMPRGEHALSAVQTFAATLGVVVSIAALVYGWTAPAAPRAAVGALWLVAWVYPGNSTRVYSLVLLMLVYVWTVAAGRPPRVIPFVALEALWSLLFLLYEGSGTLASLAVAGALAAYATCGFFADRSGVSALLAALMLVSFVVDNAWPYLVYRWQTIYDLEVSAPVCVLTAGVLASSVHFGANPSPCNGATVIHGDPKAVPGPAGRLLLTRLRPGRI